MNNTTKILPALSRLNPSTDTLFPVDLKQKLTQRRPGGIRGILYDMATTGDGATLEAMFKAARSSGLRGWTKLSHWNGPKSTYNGIGMLRRHGDLRYTASSRKWKLSIPSALSRLTPSTDIVFPVDLKTLTQRRPGGVRGILYDMVTTSDGATLEEMFKAARNSRLHGWTKLSQWDGPQSIHNGIGMLRRHGDLCYTASSRKWKLLLR
jgi:hypothetical protein